jgi:hypothetical protein
MVDFNTPSGDSETDAAADFSAAVMSDIAQYGPIPCVAVILASRALGLPASIAALSMGLAQATGVLAVADAEGTPCLPTDAGALVYLTDKGAAMVAGSREPDGDTSRGDPSLN